MVRTTRKRLKPEIQPAFRTVEIEKGMRALYLEWTVEINNMNRDQRAVFSQSFLETLHSLYGNVMNACEFSSFWEPEKRVHYLTESIKTLEILVTQVMTLEQMKILSAKRKVALVNKFEKLNQNLHSFRVYVDERYAKGKKKDGASAA